MKFEDRLHIVKENGFQGVEINFEPNEEYNLDVTANDLRKMLRITKRIGIEVSAVYSRQQWHNPISSSNLARRKVGVQIIEKLVDIARQLDSETVLVIPGVVDNSLFVPNPEITPYLDVYTSAQDSLEHLITYAGNGDPVVLALENVWGKFLYSPREFATFVDHFANDLIKIYLDIGNVLRIGYPEDWVQILGNRIHAIQVKDFRKSIDNIEGFVGLLQGDVNWPKVAQSLRDISYDGWVTSEVLPAYKYFPDLLIEETSRAINRIFENLESKSTTSTY
jgi:L-ribulose-5-phosphate 3-epimerase